MREGGRDNKRRRKELEIREEMRVPLSSGIGGQFGDVGRDVEHDRTATLLVGDKDRFLTRGILKWNELERIISSFK